MTDEQKNKEDQTQAPEQPKAEDQNASRATREDMPEPPLSWRPHQDDAAKTTLQSPDTRSNQSTVGSRTVVLNQTEQELLANARKQISISQICAVVSIFIGGVLLSSIALVFAILGYMKLSAIANSKTGDPSVKSALKRPGILAIVLCAFALTVNLVAMIYMYPMVVQALQSGDYSSIFGFGQGGAGTPAGSSSTWG